MSTPTTELVFFKDYQPEKPEHGPTMKTLSEQTGCVRIFHSKQVEDESIGIWAVEWDALSFHQAIIDNKEFYGPFVGEIMKFSGGPFKLIHVNFSSSRAFEAPVTEVFSVTLKADGNRKEVEEVLDSVIQRLQKYPGAVGPEYGLAVENADEYVVICGWDSVEAHYAAPRDDSIKDKITNNATAVMRHGKFQRF